MSGDSMRPESRSRPRSPLILGALWTSFGLWVVALSLVSALPANNAPGIELPHFDKVMHFSFFFVGAGLLGAALRESFGRWSGVVFWIALGVMAGFGLLDEWRQLHVPGRSGGDFFDWLADLSGAACGLLVLRSIYGRFGNRDTD